MDLRERFALYLKQSGASQSAAAKSIGMSSAAVSTWLNGKYAGDVRGLEEKIEAYLRLQENRRADKKLQIAYVRTQSGRRIADTLHLAHAECEPVVVYGQAGLGKTAAVADYAAKNPDVLLIEADPTYTAKVVLKKLAEQAGADAKGNLHELMEGVIGRLKDSGRLVIVDEAELLPLRSLECLRRIHDKAGVGLALVGMPRLLVNLRGSRGELKQLFSRIAFKLDLGDETADTELAQIAESSLKGADAATIAELVTAARGNTRRLVKLLRGVSRLSKLHQEPADAEMVRQFAQMLIH